MAIVVPTEVLDDLINLVLLGLIHRGQKVGPDLDRWVELLRGQLLVLRLDLHQLRLLVRIGLLRRENRQRVRVLSRVHLRQHVEEVEISVAHQLVDHSVGVTRGDRRAMLSLAVTGAVVHVHILCNSKVQRLIIHLPADLAQLLGQLRVSVVVDDLADVLVRDPGVHDAARNAGLVRSLLQARHFLVVGSSLSIVDHRVVRRLSRV